jgi:hypothetical protein
MNKLLIPALAAISFGLFSCEKCATCTCENTIEFEFSDSTDNAISGTIETAYTNAFNEDYPEMAAEVCSKRRNYSDSIAAFEGQSYYFTESHQVGGEPWSIDAKRECVCVE